MVYLCFVTGCNSNSNKKETGTSFHASTNVEFINLESANNPPITSQETISVSDDNENNSSFNGTPNTSQHNNIAAGSSSENNFINSTIRHIPLASIQNKRTHSTGCQTDNKELEAVKKIKNVYM